MRTAVSLFARLACVAVLLAAVSLVFGAERKEKLTKESLPPSIQQAIAKEFPQGEITAAEKEVEGEDPGQFDIEVTSGGKKYEVEVSPDGTIKEKKEVSEANDKDEEGEDEEGESAKESPADKAGKQWTESFNIEKYTFSSTGDNPFFPLKPGHQITLKNDSESVIITVLDETKKVGNVETRVVEERESEDGKLIEVSRNFFAQCKETGDVFYFGEEVDDYKDGKLVGHGGAWRADEKDSRAGIIMPGRILLGARHYQEIAPNAKDRAEIVADNVTLKTPAGEFKNCIRVEETSGLNPKEKGYKTYAPGIGLIQDEDLLLVSHGMADKK